MPYSMKMYVLLQYSIFSINIVQFFICINCIYCIIVSYLALQTVCKFSTCSFTILHTCFIDFLDVTFSHHIIEHVYIDSDLCTFAAVVLHVCGLLPALEPLVLLFLCLYWQNTCTHIISNTYVYMYIHWGICICKFFMKQAPAFVYFL